MAAVVVVRKPGRGVDIAEPSDDVGPPSPPPKTPQRPLLVGSHGAGEQERMTEAERRRELERAAMSITWEGATPLSSEAARPPPPPGGRSRAGLDPRRLAETLPPVLLTPFFSQRGARGDAEEGRPMAIWKAVFSGYKKDRKKKDRTSLPAKMAAAALAEQGGTRARERRVTDMHFRGQSQTWSEDSELTCSAVMERCSLNPRANLRLELFDLASDLQRESIQEEEDQEGEEASYVPHALAFRRAYAIKRRAVREDVSPKGSSRESSCLWEAAGAPTGAKEASDLSVSDTLFQRGGEEEQLDARITRRVQMAARKQAKQEQLKRLHRAQIIQRQLEQVEEKQRQLEERGVAVEKALRGEADYWGDSSDHEDLDLHLSSMGRQDDPALMQRWFQLVQQKNTLVRYESQLMIFARELELEDRQSRLQQELRERMAVDDHLKGEGELTEERLILGEMLEVVEQRDALVALLDERRLQDSQEDRDLEAVMLSRGLGLLSA